MEKSVRITSTRLPRNRAGAEDICHVAWMKDRLADGSPFNGRRANPVRLLSVQSTAEELDALIDRFAPEIAGRGRAALDRLRAHLPGAVELVYDNYNALVIGFGPSEKPSDAVLSLVLYPRQVNVCFLWGAELFDPEHVLRGRGARARTIAVDDPQRLDESAIRLLIDQAATRVPWTDRSKDARRIVMRSISARQRPRRPM